MNYAADEFFQSRWEQHPEPSEPTIAVMGSLNNKDAELMEFIWALAHQNLMPAGAANIPIETGFPVLTLAMGLLDDDHGKGQVIRALNRLSNLDVFIYSDPNDVLNPRNQYKLISRLSFSSKSLAYQQSLLPDERITLSVGRVIMEISQLHHIKQQLFAQAFF